MTITAASLVPFSTLGESYVIGVVNGLQKAYDLTMQAGIELTPLQRQILSDRFRTTMLDISSSYEQRSAEYVEGLIASYEAAGGR